MAGGSLLALLDDIAAILDDVAAMTKLATKKTAGVLSDDLALNAQQISGVRANRELPVVWSVAKGSLLNKLIIIPFILLISQFLPILIKILLVIGGLYLCYEGAEKVIHSIHNWRHKAANPQSLEQKAEQMLQDENTIRTLEKQKIKGAIRTDFILSAEIMVIALDVVLAESLMMKIGVLLFVALIITIGVYGFVTLIIKLDDMGYWLIKKNQEKNRALFSLGKVLVTAAPKLMKFLSLVGVIAMFLVGGGIILHNVSILHGLQLAVMSLFVFATNLSLLMALFDNLFIFIFGLCAGLVVLVIIELIMKLLPNRNEKQKP